MSRSKRVHVDLLLSVHVLGEDTKGATRTTRTYGIGMPLERVQDLFLSQIPDLFHTDTHESACSPTLNLFSHQDSPRRSP